MPLIHSSLQYVQYEALPGLRLAGRPAGSLFGADLGDENLVWLSRLRVRHFELAPAGRGYDNAPKECQAVY